MLFKRYTQLMQNRTSSITGHHDDAGDYEVETFDASNPKRVIVAAHGNGVRRWDGEKFFYAVAEHYIDSTVMLVDQNQPEGDGCRLNSLPTAIARVQGLVNIARKTHPGIPILVMGHSMGCGVASLLDLTGVSAVVFVAPAASSRGHSLVKRYGPDIMGGKAVTTSDGLLKVITKEYALSVKEIVWEEEYRKLLKHFSPVYCFEAGEEEIVGEERIGHRALPFTQYEIIPGAHHNLAGAPLRDFLARLDQQLATAPVA
jgi:pimeloyl-ACP methyl ester carboxylesterase